MDLFDAPISRRSFAKSTVALSAGLAAGIPAATVLAQDATPAAAPGLPPLPEGAVTVAQGLFSPRFLALGDDATLYITDAGIGGDEVLAAPAAPAPEATPGATPVGDEAVIDQGPPPTRGQSGQIVSVTADGTQTVVASGLPSYTLGPGAAVGPAGIVLGDGEVFFAVGGAAVGNFGAEEVPGENVVNRLDPATGEVTQIVAIGQYEIDNNPDGSDVNPNLYQMAQGSDGRLVVTDAGGNTVFAVDPATGELELLTVVPPLGELPDDDAVPEGQAGRHPVPTGVIVAGGTTFIGLLSEFWPEGAPSVLTLNADGTLAAVAGPLSFNVGLAVGPDGQIYASQLMTPPAEGSEEPGLGSVVRIYGDGTVETVIEGLPAPHGVAFDIAGNMYVPVYSAFFSTPDAPVGMVVRFDGVAAVE